jgi:hypothetical protein
MIMLKCRASAFVPRVVQVFPKRYATLTVFLFLNPKLTNGLSALGHLDAVASMPLLLAGRERFNTEYESRIYPTHSLALRAIPRSAWVQLTAT